MPKLRAKHHSLQQARPGLKGFDKSCGCQFHHESDNHCYLINIKKGRKITKEVLNLLREQDYIKKWTIYICKGCISKATKGKLNSEEPREEAVESDSTESDDLHVHVDPLEAECELVGKKVGQLVKDDITYLYHQHKPTLSDLLNYDSAKWLSERPPALVNLLKLICGLDKIDDKKSYLLAKAIEQIYFVKNSKLILPLCMRENVLLYSLTTSKLASTFKSSVSPSGSYRTLLRCFDSEAETPIPVPDGTVRCAFDNNQIIGKTYIIKGDNKVPTSVLCSSAYIELDQTDIQQDERLAPASWMWNQLNEKKDDLLVLTDAYDEYFRDTRDNLLKQYILEVAHEHTQVGTDCIDELVAKQIEHETEKVCVDCGGENDASYRVCRNCGGLLIKSSQPNLDATSKKTCQLYANFSGVVTQLSQAKVISGEPDFINPNSFETIVKVLQNLGVRADIKKYGGEKRHWLFVECDGAPYKIMRDLMDNLWLCERCNKSFYGLNVFETHMCHVLHKNTAVRELSWIVPVVGLLHLEMNAARSFLRLNWKVFISKLSYVLGFKSEKAQKYCLKGSDHHKTWHLLEIFYVGFTKELLSPYIKECMKKGDEPTVEKYWAWSEKVQDPNYAYLQQMTFTHLHALMLFRVGVRRNNLTAISAGRAKFSPLFYAQHHPKYQEILFRDMHDQVLMPKEVKAALHKSYTTNRTGNTDHYQGGDACLEEINKDAKSWLKHTGVPNDARWRRVFRNLDKLKKVREAVMEDAHVPDPGHNTERKAPRGINIREVDLVRSTVRRSGYLATPMEPKTHMSIDGVTELNPELVNFSVTSKELTQEYVEAALEGKAVKLQKVCVTAQEAEESNKIESLTIPQIKDQIHVELEKLSPEDASEFQQAYQKTVKSGLKQNYIKLYYEVVEASFNTDEESSSGDESSDSDDETDL